MSIREIATGKTEYLPEGMEPKPLWICFSREEALQIVNFVGRKSARTREEYEQGKLDYFVWAVPLPSSTDWVKPWPVGSEEALIEARMFLHFCGLQEAVEEPYYEKFMRLAQSVDMSDVEAVCKLIGENFTQGEIECIMRDMFSDEEVDETKKSEKIELLHPICEQGLHEGCPDVSPLGTISCSCECHKS